ncbi:hypothetical protein [Ramlibacter albus]|uniref:Uncharacterized protein n=1 Tax=Ramlibacter albus TaxID=2079448 RepID=A0A923M8Z6_9BURK|nr:hypothetical protein [Ramlibacter albus]MBC5766497.1 hypothetical protein [Ramlibacter albus]
MMYIVTIEGRNCMVPVLTQLEVLQIEPAERLGFITTRCVKALDERHAGFLAAALVTDELARTKYLRNPDSTPPVFRIDSLRQMQPGDDPVVNRGFTFFPERAPQTTAELS